MSDSASYMRLALGEARAAADRGEVPVGAVLVDAAGARIVASSGNRIQELGDPTAHAEMLVIRAAAAETGAPRLPDFDLYVTLEPCAMCAGAAVLARIPRLVFGAADPKTGACGSLRNVVQDVRLNHRCEVVGGVLEEECAALLQSFFARLR